MQLRQSNGEGVRLSISSAPSCSSLGSGQDDIESLGDVYIWGAVWSDSALADEPSLRPDILFPRPLETNVVLDVHQIACGVRHAALVTRQGEVFTWGEESGGCLGHGFDSDSYKPQLVESLSVNNMDCVACGEYHSCAVSASGDLFSWGDGIYGAGLLGHGTDFSHWVPKRVCGILEGHQVLSVSCGTWHSALVTSSGKLFTFGDGSFGVLGHGNRESVLYPKEVDSLSGFKVIKVACGVYHTAAIVEVSGHVNTGILSRRLFTWGDGEKYRLGHGDKECRLVPTCVSSLVDYNFNQLACGVYITVALTTSGHVFTMGHTLYGQLGNPQSDGRVPCLVQDKLVGESVEEISCGAFHVAVLTSGNEVFTWGNGANGRLGHGDVEDRKTPTLIEGLKDRQVKSISCGSNFTASICIHKWVSAADQSICSGCRQAFGFTRKRHNCYNCGLVHCHACSSRKVLNAALAPTPRKPHRVCDSCYAKLKASEAVASPNASRKSVVLRRPTDNREKNDSDETRCSKILSPLNLETVRLTEMKSVKQGHRPDSSTMRAQVPSLLQLKEIAFPGSVSVLQTAVKPIATSQTTAVSRHVSPYSRRPSSPRSAAPVFSKSVIDSLKKTNEFLNQEVLKLQTQVKLLKQKCDFQDIELRKHGSVTKDSNLLNPNDCTYTSETTPIEDVPNSIMANMAESTLWVDEVNTELGLDDSVYGARLDLSRDVDEDGQSRTAAADSKETHIGSTEDKSRSPRVCREKRNTEEVQVTEQFEPGVYVTLQLLNGVKVFKRVRFSKRRFDEQQAETWWKENKERMLMKYNCYANDHASSGMGLTNASAVTGILARDTSELK